MTIVESLTHDLKAIAGSVHVDEYQGSVRVTLPNPRQVHDTTTILLAQQGDQVLMSDGGFTAFLLTADFEEVISAMSCGGAPFHARGKDVVATYPADGNLAYHVLEFSLAVSSVPLVWHSLACVRKATPRIPPASVEMARAERARLSARFADAAPYLRVGEHVHGAIDRVTAPLQLARPARNPGVVIACIDTTAPQRSYTQAKANTSHLLAATHGLRNTARIALVRGGDAELDLLRSLYEDQRVQIVSTADRSPIDLAVDQALAAL